MKNIKWSDFDREIALWQYKHELKLKGISEILHDRVRFDIQFDEDQRIFDALMQISKVKGGVSS